MTVLMLNDYNNNYTVQIFKDVTENFTLERLMRQFMLLVIFIHAFNLHAIKIRVILAPHRTFVLIVAVVNVCILTILGAVI